MSKLVDIDVAIEGVTPLLCNRFTDAAALSATDGTRASTVGDRGTAHEQAEQSLYLSAASGKPIIPQPNLLRSVIDAGKFFKNGKSKITTQKSTIVTSCVDINQVEIALEHTHPWRVDTRAVRIPGGGRILRHRACFEDWRLGFELSLDTSIMSAKLLREVVDAAGKRIGLGDFRPDCKGPYGKFVVTRWVVNDPIQAAATAEPACV